MQGALTQLRSWKLDHKNEDIRGWALRDPDGHVLGTVGELIVDTDSKHVTQVVLGDGKRYAAQYFAQNILPNVTNLAGVINGEDVSALDVPEEALGC